MKNNGAYFIKKLRTVSFNEDQAIKVGDEFFFDLHDDFSPATALNKSDFNVTAVGDSSILTFNSYGVLTAKAAGPTTVTISDKVGEVSKTYPITIVLPDCPIAHNLVFTHSKSLPFLIVVN